MVDEAATPSPRFRRTASPTMNAPCHHVRRASRIALLFAATFSSLLGQVAPRTNESTSEVVRLDPFSVSAGADEGYSAKSSASGLGFVVDVAKLPITVNTLTPALLDDLGVVKVEDALRYVSGVSNEGRTSKTESYILRGFVTGANLRNGEIFSVPTDIAVIDRVEVLKGPASIVYGVADPAGVVNSVTKKASMRRAASSSLLWDEYGSARAIVDVNQPLVSNRDVRLAGRFVLAHGREGFARPNEFRDRTIFAPNFRLELGRNTVVDLDLHHTKENGRINRIQIPWDRGNPPYDASIFANGLVPVTRDFTWVTPNDDWDFRSEGLDLRVTQHLSDRLTLQVAFVRSQIDREHYFNLGNGRLAPNAQGEYLAGNTQMVVEPSNIDHRGLSAKLLWDTMIARTNHKFTLGFRDNWDVNYEYAYYDNAVRADPTLRVIADRSGGRTVRFQGAPRTVFRLTDPNVLTLSGTTAATNPNPVTVRSAYASDYITMPGEKLNLLLGVSYVDIVTQKKSKVVPQAGFVYDLGRGVGAYGLYSQSAKANGPASTLNPALGFLPPEEGEGKEIGLRFDPAASKLTGTLALFEIKRSNIVQFLGGGLFTQNNNIPSGEEISRGVELDLIYSPTPEWTLLFAYANTRAYISQQEISVTPDYNGDGVSDAVGLDKEGVARNDVRVWTSYRLDQVPALRGLTIGGGLTWREGPIKQFAGYIQRKIEEKGDPTRVDLFIAKRMKLAGREFKAQANWYNATDANYLDRRGYIVQPSTLTFTLDTKW
jgi:iron complex outermembrane receptor protein